MARNIIEVKGYMAERKKERYVLLFFLILSFLLRVFYITKVKGPFVYTDELGYWGHAANLTGNTWSGVMNGMPWYAFGYSLLLAPLFWITTDVVWMYRMAVVLNAILGILCLIIAYQLLLKVQIRSTQVPARIVWAFTAVSYSAYIFNSHIAWSETLLSFLMWLILYEMVLLEESPKCWKGVLLGATAGYSYMVHNRMLAVAAAVLIVVFFLLWSRRIKAYHLACVVGAVVMVLLLNSVMKDYLKFLLGENRFLQEMGIHARFGTPNTFADQLLKVKQIFTVDGFMRFLLNLAGQIWQFLSATYLLAGLGIAFCIRKAYESMKSREMISLYLFPVTALLFTVLMTSLFFIENNGNTMEGPVRIDTFFYGRYNDVLMGLLVLMAFFVLGTRTQMKEYGKYIPAVCLVYLAASLIVRYSLKNIGDFYLNVVSSESIHIFHWLGQFAVWKCVLITLAVGICCFALACIKMPERINSYLISGLLVFLFFTTALTCMRFTIKGENDYTQQYAEIFDYLKENTEAEEPVFTFADGKLAYDLQTRLADRAVICIDAGQIDYVGNSRYLVMPEQEYDDLAYPDYRECLQAQDVVILQKREN